MELLNDLFIIKKHQLRLPTIFWVEINTNSLITLSKYKTLYRFPLKITLQSVPLNIIKVYFKDGLIPVHCHVIVGKIII